VAVSQKRNKWRKQQAFFSPSYDPNAPATARVWTERFMMDAASGRHLELEQAMAGVHDPGGIIRQNLISRARVFFLANKQLRGLITPDPEVSEPTDWVALKQRMESLH